MDMETIPETSDRTLLATLLRMAPLAEAPFSSTSLTAANGVYRTCNSNRNRCVASDVVTFIGLNFVLKQYNRTNNVIRVVGAAIVSVAIPVTQFPGRTG